MRKMRKNFCNFYHHLTHTHITQLNEMNQSDKYMDEYVHLISDRSSSSPTLSLSLLLSRSSVCVWVCREAHIRLTHLPCFCCLHCSRISSLGPGGIFASMSAPSVMSRSVSSVSPAFLKLLSYRSSPSDVSISRAAA